MLKCRQTILSLLCSKSTRDFCTLIRWCALDKQYAFISFFCCFFYSQYCHFSLTVSSARLSTKHTRAHTHEHWCVCMCFCACTCTHTHTYIFSFGNLLIISLIFLLITLFLYNFSVVKMLHLLHFDAWSYIILFVWACVWFVFDQESFVSYEDDKDLSWCQNFSIYPSYLKMFCWGFPLNERFLLYLWLNVYLDCLWEYCSCPAKCHVLYEIKQLIEK